jgi:hypothetical protein
MKPAKPRRDNADEREVMPLSQTKEAAQLLAINPSQQRYQAASRCPGA